MRRILLLLLLIAGIAIITTIMSRKTVQHSADVGSHLQATDPNVQARLAGMQQMFVGKGMTTDMANQSGYKLMDANVLRQASTMSYMDVFMFVGIIFLICVPFVLLTKSRKKTAAKVDLSEAMH